MRGILETFMVVLCKFWTHQIANRGHNMKYNYNITYYTKSSNLIDIIYIRFYENKNLHSISNENYRWHYTSIDDTYIVVADFA